MSFRFSAASCLALAAFGTPGAPTAAQAPDTLPPSSLQAAGLDLTVELRTGGAYLNNFFQAAAGEPREDILAGTGELWMSLPLDRWSAGMHASVGGTFYGNFDPSYALLAGAHLGRRVHRVEGTVSYRARSPRMEVGDTLGFADVLFASTSYALRPTRILELRALAEVDHQAYHRTRDRDNRALQVGAGARYLGFGYAFSPEIGAARGRRDVRVEAEDYDERSFWVTLRSAPTPDYYVSLRYRNRWREYSGRDPASRNLGREDERRDLTLTVDISLSDRWSWTAYASSQDASSTNVARSFRAHYLLTSLSYRLR